MFPGAERGKGLFCTRQTLSGSPFYRAKMLPTATPVVHGNRLLTPLPPPAREARYKPETVRCGRGIGREGAAPPPCQRPPQNARRKALRESRAFKQALLSRKDASDCNPRRPWKPPGGSNAAKLDDSSWGAGGGAKRPSRLRRSRNGAGSLIAGFSLAPGTLATGFPVI